MRVVAMSGPGTSRRNERPELTSGFGVKQTLSIDGNDAIDPDRTSAAWPKILRTPPRFRIAN
jgi:hypothetical protein